MVVVLFKEIYALILRNNAIVSMLWIFSTVNFFYWLIVVHLFIGILSSLKLVFCPNGAVMDVTNPINYGCLKIILSINSSKKDVIVSFTALYLIILIFGYSLRSIYLSILFLDELRLFWLTKEKTFSNLKCFLIYFIKKEYCATFHINIRLQFLWKEIIFKCPLI